jgi:succinoglycan biosynthesis transport protein ExoP
MSKVHSAYSLQRASSPFRGPFQPAVQGPVIDVTHEGSVVEYFRALFQRKWLVAFVTLVFGGVGLVTSLREQPLYRARTSVEVMELNENFLNRKEVDPNAAPNTTSTEAYLQTQTKLLQSESLVERVIKKLKIDERPQYLQQTPRWGFLTFYLKLQAASDSSPLRRAIDDCKSNLRVEAPGESRVLEVTFDSPAPQEAADFVNTLVNEYIDQSLEVRWNSSQHTGEWLSKQLRETKQKLEKAEGDVQNYARTQNLLFTSEKENVTADKLRLVQQDLVKAQADRMAAESQFDLLSNTPPESLPKILDDGTLRDYQGKLAELRRQYAELNVSLTPANEKVQRVEAQIHDLEATVNRAQTDLVNRIRNEYQASVAKEHMAQASYDKQAALVSDQAAKNAQYDLLRHEVDTTREIYEGMLRKVQDAGVASAIGANNLRVVDAAISPSAPFKPRTSLNVAMGMVAGLFLSLAYVSLGYHNKKELNNPRYLSSQLGIPELGVIPSSASDPAWRRNGGPIELAAATRSSLLAASFQSTLLSILYSSGARRSPKVLAVTSPSSGEGKTTVASNLAIALTQLNPGVLLIDGDIRRPRLHDVFGIRQVAGGLAEMLSDTRPVSELKTEQYIRPTKIPGLSVLPAGSLPDLNIPQALYSHRLEALIARLRKEYSAVVIDTPPVLLFPDARILAKRADCVAFVVRANRTGMEWASAAHHRLIEDGASVLGVVVNDFKAGGVDHPFVDYSSPSPSRKDNKYFSITG